MMLLLFIYLDCRIRSTSSLQWIHAVLASRRVTLSSLLSTIDIFFS